MSGLLQHSQADVLAQALQGLSLVETAGIWPVKVDHEPTDPNDVVTVYNTEGSMKGRLQPNGGQVVHHGVQVRVRSAGHLIGFRKAIAIAVAMDESIYLTHVNVGGTTYILYSVGRTSDVLSLGHDTPATKRDLFTINATVVLRQTN